MWLIHGLFFQKGPRKCVGVEDREMYSGIIRRHKTTGDLSGGLTDRWGRSKLSNIQLSEDRLSFTKRYDFRPALEYAFVLHEGIWLGSYTGLDAGRGESWCILHEVKDEMFDSAYLDKLFKDR